jgi:hypothetical protein
MLWVRSINILIRRKQDLEDQQKRVAEALVAKRAKGIMIKERLRTYSRSRGRREKRSSKREEIVLYCAKYPE